MLWDAVIKEMHSLGKNLVMVDEHKQDAMVASKRCKSIQKSLVQRPREEAQKTIVVPNSASREELIALGITKRISVLVAARRMTTKHNMLQNALTRINIIQQGVEKFNKLFETLFQKGLPDFWGPKGKLIPKRKYVELL